MILSILLFIIPCFMATAAEDGGASSSTMVNTAYPIANLTLLEKIKLTKVLDKVLLGHQNPLYEPQQPQSVSASTQAVRSIEMELQKAPQYSKLEDKFIQILPIADALVEEAWPVKAPQKLDPMHGIPPRQSVANKAQVWHTFEKYKKNLDSQERLNAAHAQELRERGSFRNFLNLAKFYKLGECLATKLVNIFDEKKGHLSHLNHYKEKRTQFAHAFEQVSKMLLDSRGKNVHHRLECPQDSVTDRVDGSIVEAIESNQFSTGMEDNDFVDALVTSLQIGGTVKNENVQNYTSAEQLEVQLKNYEFGMARGILQMVQNIEKDILTKRQRQSSQKAAQNTGGYLVSMRDQIRLGKQNLNRVAAVPVGHVGDTTVSSDKRSSELHAILSARMKSDAPSKERLLLNRIVPLLMGFMKDNNANEVLKENALKYANFVELACLFGYAEFVTKIVAKRLATKTSNVAHDKYMAYASHFGQFRQKSINAFVNFVARNNPANVPKDMEEIKEDLELIEELIFDKALVD